MSTDHEVAPVPQVGDRAPFSEKIPFPSPKPAILVFLRQCGDPCRSRFLPFSPPAARFSMHDPRVSHCPGLGLGPLLSRRSRTKDNTQVPGIQHE